MLFLCQSDGNEVLSTYLLLSTISKKNEAPFEVLGNDWFLSFESIEGEDLYVFFCI